MIIRTLLNNVSVVTMERTTRIQVSVILTSSVERSELQPPLVFA